MVGDWWSYVFWYDRYNDDIYNDNDGINDNDCFGENKGNVKSDVYHAVVGVLL